MAEFTPEDRGIGTDRRSTVKSPLDRIIELLRPRYKKNDSLVLERVEALKRAFNELSAAEATTLLDSLEKPKKGDELVVLFQYNLSGITRYKLKAILQKKITESRGIEKTSGRIRSDKDLRTLNRYIDNLAEGVKYDFFNPPYDYIVSWREGSGTKEIRISEQDVIFGDSNIQWREDTIFSDRESALIYVTELIQETGGSDSGLFYSFYRGPYNVILPTRYSHPSTPRIYEAIIRERARWAKMGQEISKNLKPIREGLALGIMVGPLISRLLRRTEPLEPIPLNRPRVLGSSPGSMNGSVTLYHYGPEPIQGDIARGTYWTNVATKSPKIASDVIGGKSPHEIRFRHEIRVDQSAFDKYFKNVNDRWVNTKEGLKVSSEYRSVKPISSEYITTEKMTSPNED